MDILRALMLDEAGTTGVETALVAVLVSIAAFLTYAAFGQVTAGLAQEASNAMESVH